jgi:hypothetical protein
LCCYVSDRNFCFTGINCAPRHATNRIYQSNFPRKNRRDWFWNPIFCGISNISCYKANKIFVFIVEKDVFFALSSSINMPEIAPPNLNWKCRFWHDDRLCPSFSPAYIFYIKNRFPPTNLEFSLFKHLHSYQIFLLFKTEIFRIILKFSICAYHDSRTYTWFTPKLLI